MRHSGVIFDLDGTLLDTLADLGRSMNLVLEGLSLTVLPLEAYRGLVGEGQRRLVERALPAGHRAPEEIDAALVRMKEFYRQGWKEETRPYAGIPELLEDLSRTSLKLGVFSNKIDEFARLSVEHFFPAGTFAAVMGQREDYPRKPDPAMGLVMAREWGLRPGEIVYVGDTEVDMQTAVRAGMLPVGVAWGFREPAMLIEHGARHIIRHPAELKTLI